MTALHDITAQLAAVEAAAKADPGNAALVQATRTLDALRRAPWPMAAETCCPACGTAAWAIADPLIDDDGSLGRATQGLIP